MPRKTTRTVKDPAQQVERYLRLREAAKRGYARADRLLLEIARWLEPGMALQLSARRTAHMVDHFAKCKQAWSEGDVKHLVLWGHAAVRPYEIEVSEE